MAIADKRMVSSKKLFPKVFKLKIARNEENIRLKIKRFFRCRNITALDFQIYFRLSIIL